MFNSFLIKKCLRPSSMVKLVQSATQPSFFAHPQRQSTIPSGSWWQIYGFASGNVLMFACIIRFLACNIIIRGQSVYCMIVKKILFLSPSCCKTWYCQIWLRFLGLEDKIYVVMLYWLQQRALSDAVIIKIEKDEWKLQKWIWKQTLALNMLRDVNG